MLDLLVVSSCFGLLQKLPVTRIVQNLMDNKGGLGNEVDDYEYFDPKVLKGGSAAAELAHIPRTKNPFTESIVFVVGGGNYVEFQNLIDLFNNVSALHQRYLYPRVFKIRTMFRGEKTPPEHENTLRKNFGPKVELSCKGRIIHPFQYLE